MLKSGLMPKDRSRPTLKNLANSRTVHCTLQETEQALMTSLRSIAIISCISAVFGPLALAADTKTIRLACTVEGFQNSENQGVWQRNQMTEKFALVITEVGGDSTAQEHTRDRYLEISTMGSSRIGASVFLNTRPSQYSKDQLTFDGSDSNAWRFNWNLMDRKKVFSENELFLNRYTGSISIKFKGVGMYAESKGECKPASERLF